MDRQKFVIEPAESESMLAESNLTVRQLLASLVKPAQCLARPPISNYHVGAVGLGSSGRIYFGVNLEFPGLPLHHTVHAEQFLATNLLLHRERELRYVAVSAAPCGHCRQFLQEIHDAANIGILITDQAYHDRGGEDGFDRLSSILPRRFGPDDLLEKDIPLLLEPHNHLLSFSESDSDRWGGEICIGDVVPGGGLEAILKLKHVALDAASRSHAPYSASPSGVALLDCEGKVYKGSYVESAAHNPSLGPVQAAVVDYVANGGGGGYERIVQAVLVEKANAVVKQEDAARFLLRVISPKCEFQVFHCR